MNGTLYINNIGDFMVRYTDGDHYQIIPIIDDEFYLWFEIYLNQDNLEVSVQFELETVEVTTKKKDTLPFIEIINYARYAQIQNPGESTQGQG